MHANGHHQHDYQQMRMLFAIVNNRSGSTVTKILSDFGVMFHMACLSHGTAPHWVLSELSIDPEKETVIAIVTAEQAPEILSAIDSRLKLTEEGTGVAFTSPLKSIGGRKTYEYLTTSFIKQTD